MRIIDEYQYRTSIDAGGPGSGRHPGYLNLAKQAAGMLKDKGFRYRTQKDEGGNSRFVLQHQDGRTAEITNRNKLGSTPDENTIQVHYQGNMKHDSLLDELQEPHGLQGYLAMPPKWEKSLTKSFVQNLNENAHKSVAAAQQIRAGGPPSDKGPGSGNYDHKAIEHKFRADLKSDWEGSKAAYIKKFGNTINADNAKELSPEYRADRSLGMSVHEPASELVKAVYADLLKQPAPPGKLNTVTFTAGAPGVGKTTGLEGTKHLRDIADKSHVVYDGTMADPVSGAKKIDQALDAGKSVHVIYVHRDPIDSFKNGILPRAEKMGRMVPLSEAAEQHAKVQDSMDMLIKKYKDNPRVTFAAIDNSRGTGKAVEAPFEKIPRVKDDKASLTHKMTAALEEEFKAGRVSEKNYHAAKGVSHGRHT